MKKGFIICAALVMTLTFSTAAFADETTPVTPPVTEVTAPVTETAVTEVQTSIESAVNSDIAKDSSIATSEVKDDVLKAKEAKTLKKRFVEEYKVLEGLRAECKALWTSIKAKNAEIKTAWANLKASVKGKPAVERKAIYSDVNTKLAPFRAAVVADHTSIKALRADKKQAWADYKAAMNAKNTVDAKAAVDRILSLKGQIIEKQKDIMTQKTEILNIINGAIVK